MLFFRALLRHCPRPSSLALVALAALQIVAASWHVCDFGLSASCHQMAQNCDAGPPRALICICRTEKPEIPPGTPLLAADERHQFHGDCLAQLLQNLGGETGVAPQFLTQFAPHVAHFATRPIFHDFSGFSRFRGRAPPSAV